MTTSHIHMCIWTIDYTLHILHKKHKLAVTGRHLIKLILLVPVSTSPRICPIEVLSVIGIGLCLPKFYPLYVNNVALFTVHYGILIFYALID